MREARRQININLNSAGENAEAANAAVAAMFNEGDIKPLLESGLGVEVPEQKGGQMAVLQPSPPKHAISESGYHNEDVPYFSWEGHLDGLWNGSTGSLQAPDEDDKYLKIKGLNGEILELDVDQDTEVSAIKDLITVSLPT